MSAFTTEGKEKVDEEIESKEIIMKETQSNNEVAKNRNNVKKGREEKKESKNKRKRKMCKMKGEGK